MENGRVYTAIGLMSGTSLDGIDAALIRTDGREFVEPAQSLTVPYEDEVRAALRGCLGRREDTDGSIAAATQIMTLAHVRAVRELLTRAGCIPADIDLIGFHGQTIHHDPAQRFTWQIGDGTRLAAETGITVIGDFRSHDVAAGGQGAPLLPLYHRALCAGLPRPLVILNIGGVANVTYIGEGDDDDILAFDTGPGNALVNDWMRRHTGAEFDEGGRLAASGAVHEGLVRGWLADSYFQRTPPKSLDRDAWNTLAQLDGLPPADGAATLCAFTVQSIARAREYFPATPLAWYVAGGGRHNPVFVTGLRRVLGAPVESVDRLGWDGDALEAQGFAYLAVRSFLGLPLSLPTTTGVPQPMTGGKIFKAA